MSGAPGKSPSSDGAGAPHRAVVVDDEPAARDAVVGFLAAEPRIEVVGTATDGREAVERVRALAPDLLFLDVQMPDLDGFGVLDALGDDVPQGVVLVTAHDQHAVRAFEVHALDYVLKPFGAARFGRTVARALHRLEAENALSARATLDAALQGLRTRGSEPVGEAVPPSGPGRPRRLGVRHGTRTLLVEVDRIRWIEADGDWVRVHTDGRTHLVADTMHRLETVLAPDFLRVHRSILVNVSCVRLLDRDPDGGGTLTLDDGVRLRVARSRWSDLGRALGLPGDAP